MSGRRRARTRRGWRDRRYAVVLAAAVVVPVALLAPVACSSGGEAELPTSTHEGGVVTLLTSSPIVGWDPQRVADPTASALTGRLLWRTLTAYAPADDETTGDRLVGDLATDTGTPSADFKSWTFTLRPDAAWEDGTSVTCADLRYGIGRTFATTAVTGGSVDAISLLAVPKATDGTSSYRGPWDTSAEGKPGQEAFDAAVDCEGDTVTFTLDTAVPDFAEVLTLPAFAPVKAGSVAAAEDALPVMSNGPYRIEGSWDPQRGGTLVRNPAWEGDSDPIRKAYPDVVKIETVADPAALMARVVADRSDGVNAVSLVAAPAALQQHISAVPTLRSRALVAPTEVVDYLALNVTAGPLANRETRLALEAATARAGYAVALGGPTAARPTVSVVPDTLLARSSQQLPVEGADPAAARQRLADAGVATPVPLTVAFRPGPHTDKAMAALVANWQDAGFAPVLTPLEGDYFGTISQRSALATYDVLWTNWAPSWGSASTILPALFDSRLNLSDTTTGRNVGGWSNTTWNDSLAPIAAIADRGEREAAWAAADEQVRADVGYIALAQRYAVHLAGSRVRNLAVQPHSGGTVDLAILGVSS